jgi:exopolysaccharide biosynthesis protein
MLTLSMLETSALKSLPGVFLSPEAVDEIILLNSITQTSEITDASRVSAVMPAEEEDGESVEWAEYPEGIRIDRIMGETYRGYVMIIRDPSRVYVATSSNFENGQPGLKILDAVKREGAVAAINGGGFPDENGVGPGDVPTGLVFSKGEKLWGNENSVHSSVMGFDNNNIFIVGSFSVKAAREMGIRDALCFGPTLVVNGEPMEIKGTGGGLNPRSAIGQRQDGAVIFLCIDGRMPSSMGASFSDLIGIMLEYGAVNASNLDGGMSSTLVYEGELVNICSSLYGPRKIPTFFMVRE